MMKSFRRQTVGGFQICYCFFDIGPACILSQYCACNYLELSFARPPVLRAKTLEGKLVKLG